MKKIRQNIRHYYSNIRSKNPIFRRFIIVKNQLIIPLIIKILIIIIITLLISFFVIKITKPQLIDQYYQKTSKFFYKITGIESGIISKITIKGNDKISDQEIINIIKDIEAKSLIKNKENFQPLIHDIIDEIRIRIPWITKIRINRKLPNELDIIVEEFQPFAILQNGEKSFLVDNSGNNIFYNKNDKYQDLLIISGQDAIRNIASLFNILSTNNFIINDIYSASWVGKRRWDITLNNGLIIKLPEEGVYKAWQKLNELINISGFTINLEIIDLRIKDKIYLKYKDKTAKELMKVGL